MSDNKGGRPPYQPTEKDRRTVESLTGMGATQDEIGRILGISDVTVRKYYEQELQVGIIKANTTVAQSLFEAATKDRNVSAMIFWLKTRAGWKEQHPTPSEQSSEVRVVVELVGEAAAPAIEHAPLRPALSADFRRNVELVG